MRTNRIDAWLKRFSIWIRTEENYFFTVGLVQPGVYGFPISRRRRSVVAASPEAASEIADLFSYDAFGTFSLPGNQPFAPLKTRRFTSYSRARKRQTSSCRSTVRGANTQMKLYNVPVL